MVTYPPEMLPRADGETEVIVCADHPNCAMAHPRIAALESALRSVKVALYGRMDRIKRDELHALIDATLGEI